MSRAPIAWSLLVGPIVGAVTWGASAPPVAAAVAGVTATVCAALALGLASRRDVARDRVEPDTRWTTLLQAQTGGARETLAAVERLTDPLAIERRVTKAMRELAPGVELELLRAPQAPPGVLHRARQIDADTLGAAVVQGVVRHEQGLVVAVRYETTILGALVVRGDVAPNLLAQLRRFADLLAFRLELHRTYAELAQRERLAALGTFASALSHDLRSPLAAIQLALQGLGDHRQALGEDTELLDAALEETRRMVTLVGEILDFARPTELDAAASDLRRVIEAVAQRHGAIARSRNVRVLTQGVQRLPKVVADPARLQRALDNLVSNAVAFSPDGADVKIHAAADGMYVRIAVVDRGPGMREEERERAFEPFFTRRASGTGLGLAIVDRVVRAHGGSMQVESAPGRGTTMTMCLPIRPASDEATR